MKKSIKLGFILFGIVIMLFFVQIGASVTGGKVANLINYDKFDSDQLFAGVSVHHIVQLIVALVIMLILYYFFKINWYLNLGDKKIGFRCVGIFTIVIIVYTLISYPIGEWLNMIGPYSYPLTGKNMAGYLGFQLLLSGPSEEILFRAFPIAILAAVLGKTITFHFIKWNISIETIIAALLFSIAHIQWSLSPFFISMDYYQLIYAFVLGITYGVTYQKSKSVIYPMMMHSISNVVAIGTGYVIALIR